MSVSMDIREIQEALARVGLDPGPIDGIWGRKTVAAVKLFQGREGLAVDGIVGPETAAHLQGAGVPAPAARPGTPALPLPLPWMEEAARLVRTREFLGAASNPVILDWASLLDLPYQGDDIPWCGLFVGHCVSSTLPEQVLPNGLLRARSWGRFGSRVTPREGAVMVFTRGGEQSGNGHVGFHAGEQGNAYRILGGNQDNKVCYILIHKDRLLEARWPDTAMSLYAQAPAATAPGAPTSAGTGARTAG